jgi:hypothetical protein
MFEVVAVFPHEKGEATCHVGVSEKSEHFFDMVREVEIAVAEIANDATAGVLKGVVAIGFSAAGMLGVIEKPHARIEPFELKGGRAGVLMDAVADDEYFKVGDGLSEHAFDRQPEHGATIDRGRDNDGG